MAAMPLFLEPIFCTMTRSPSYYSDRDYKDNISNNDETKNDKNSNCHDSSNNTNTSNYFVKDDEDKEDETISYLHNTRVVDDKTQKDFNAMISLMIISFSLGFRFLFMAMPFVFYAAGPISLVIAATVMIFFLIFIDHPYSLLGRLSMTIS